MKNFTNARRLKVFSKTYDLSFVLDLEGEDQEGNTHNLDGHHLYYEEQIKIKENNPISIQWKTLWHEVVHSILPQIGYGELASNEPFVESLSNCICQVLQDNPFMRGIEK